VKLEEKLGLVWVESEREKKEDGYMA